MSEAEDELVNDLYEQYGDDDAGITKDKIREEVDNLREYSVPDDEIRRNVSQKYGNSGSGAPEPDNDGEPEIVPVSTINTDGDYVDIEVKVVKELDPSSSKISQKVIAGDESGTTVITNFESNDTRDLEVDESYLLEGVETDEWNGKYSVNLTQYTEITTLDKDIDVDEGEREFVAPVVSVVENSSGLIRRCPEDDCTRVVGDGRCEEHGAVEGENDLRVKGDIDVDGTKYTFFLDTEQTGDIIDKTLDEALQAAQDAVDRDVIRREVEDELLGHYFQMEGQIREDRDHFYVDEIERFDEDVTEQADKLLTRALGA